MVAPHCSGQACPGLGLEIATDDTLQIKNAVARTFDADLHEFAFFDCAISSYFFPRAINRIYTAAERAALSGGNLFAGLTVYESDTKRVKLYDGTGWIIMYEPLVTFTPTFTGVTDGSATKTGYYRRSGGWIDLNATWTFGAGSAVSGAGMALTLPINTSASLAAAIHGSVDILDSSSALLPGEAIPNSVSSIGIWAFSYNGAAPGLAYVSNVQCSTSVPMTWTTGDSMRLSLRYPMTTLYS